MGFMPSHVATVVLFALSAGIYVYFENYVRYDWTRYFTGFAGLDLRWTVAKRRDRACSATNSLCGLGGTHRVAPAPPLTLKSNTPYACSGLRTRALTRKSGAVARHREYEYLWPHLQPR